jgi:polyhydroxyalkanoate synthesis regulator phasin
MDTEKSPPPRFKNIGKMTQDEARVEVEDLRKTIEHHNYLYYVKAEPKISDTLGGTEESPARGPHAQPELGAE